MRKKGCGRGLQAAPEKLVLFIRGRQASHPAKGREQTGGETGCGENGPGRGWGVIEVESRRNRMEGARRRSTCGAGENNNNNTHGVDRRGT